MPAKYNQVLLLFILFLDLAGFTLIFPLIPSLLDYYTQKGNLSVNVDSWFIYLLQYLESLSENHNFLEKNKIVLLGGFITAIYSLLQFLAAPYWGKLSDRIGRKPVLLITSGGLFLSYGLWFFSNSFTLFCLSRVLSGIMGGNIGVATAAIADMNPPQKRTSAMALIGVAFGLGFILGPVLGGLATLIHLGSWHIHPFVGPALVASLLSFLSLAFNIYKFEETFKVKEREKHPWISNPFRSLSKSFNSNFQKIVFIHCAYIFIFSSYEFSFSFFYSLEFNLNAKEIAYIFLYLGFWYVIGQGFLVRILSKRFPPQTLLYIGLISIPLPIVLFGFSSPHILLSLFWLIPIPLASSLIMASSAALASLSVSAKEQGHGMGTFRSFGSLARALAPIGTAPLYWYIGAKITYLIFGTMLAFVLVYTLYYKSLLNGIKIENKKA